MTFAESLQSKSDKKISILVFELSTNPNIELIEVQGGGHRFGDKMKPGEWEVKVISFITKITNK